MEYDNYNTLYEDDKYFVLNIPASELVELGFLARGLNLNFSYGEWRRLRRIIADIELPQTLCDEVAILYRDGTYLLTADDELVRWVSVSIRRSRVDRCEFCGCV
jgi:hypothetical protein